jgi:hypothetical protein
VRYAARSQLLDWHFDRHDHMSTAEPIALTPTPQAPRTTRPVLRSVPEVCGWGPATSELDADLVAAEVLNLARPLGRFLIRFVVGTPQPGRSGHAPDNA